MDTSVQPATGVHHLGRHLLIDGRATPEALDDPQRMRDAIVRAVAEADATLIDLCVHQFSPRGVTAVATLAESHLAVHTWPELGCFSADLFFCGHGDPDRAVDALVAALGGYGVTVRSLNRGVSADDAVDVSESVPIAP